MQPRLHSKTCFRHNIRAKSYIFTFSNLYPCRSL